MNLININASNNVIIKHDNSVVFYDDGEEKVILKNNIEFLYSIVIDNKTMVFDQYNYAFSYVRQYIIANGKIA